MKMWDLCGDESWVGQKIADYLYPPEMLVKFKKV